MARTQLEQRNVYMLITVRKIVCVEIITELFQTKEEAYRKMKSELCRRLEMDGDEDKMSLLEDGIELSNAILNENDAYIYQDFGDVFHHWKIIEI